MMLPTAPLYFTTASGLFLWNGPQQDDSGRNRNSQSVQHFQGIAGRQACAQLPKTFFMLLDSYKDHPEAKSLGPDGNPCEFDTRGLLQRAHIVANWPLIYIGKESNKHWEEGEDVSLLEFKTVEYKQKGNAVATDEQLAHIADVPKREVMRRGVNQHTLEKIRKKEGVPASMLAKVSKILQQLDSEQMAKT
jgi:hypothetical protein